MQAIYSQLGRDIWHIRRGRKGLVGREEGLWLSKREMKHTEGVYASSQRGIWHIRKFVVQGGVSGTSLMIYTCHNV